MNLNEITNERHFSNPTIAAMNAEADSIQKFMDIPAILEDPTSMNYRLNTLDVYKSRLTTLITEAKDMYNRANNYFQEENEEQLNKLAVTVQARVIKRTLYEFSTTVDRLELMYRTIDGISRDLVTLISYIKAQMTLR